jgi:hypothetical protein
MCCRHVCMHIQGKGGGQECSCQHSVSEASRLGSQQVGLQPPVTSVDEPWGTKHPGNGDATTPSIF